PVGWLGRLPAGWRGRASVGWLACHTARASAALAPAALKGLAPRPFPAAILAMGRPDATHRSSARRRSAAVPGNAARVLVKSQLLRLLPLRLFMRTNTQPPLSLSPARVNFSSPLRSAALTSAVSLSGNQKPRSHSITVPPPYSPSGMVPSKSPYSSGWSSTSTANRLSRGSQDGPLVTAHDLNTPLCSRRKS